MAYYNRDRAMATPPYLLTAYGIAQRHGYSGTEEEWLASLVGAPGEAVDLRFEAETKYIQYKHESDAEWTDLVSMGDLMTEDEAAVLAAMEEIKAAVETAVETAGGHSEDSEAWAVGKRDGIDVEETDETYHNNAKYYAGEAAGSATAAAASVTSAANQSHNASVFAANAASSASSAQSSASSASSSASSASGSALSAQNSATAAAESAVSAGESASSAAAALSDAESIMTLAQTAANSAFSDAERAHNWEQEAERQAALAAGAAQGAASEVSQALQQYADRAETASGTAQNAAATATEQAGAAAASATAAAASAASVSGVVQEVTQAKTEAITAIEAKGAETLDSIPDDYTELSGDVDDLKSAINIIEVGYKQYLTSDIIQGSYNADGSVAPNQNRIRISGFVELNTGDTLRFKPGTNTASLLYGLYNENKVFQGDSTWYSSEHTITTDKHIYVICIFKNSTGTSITPADFDATVVKTLSTKNAIVNLSEMLDVSVSPTTDQIIENRFITADGTLSSESVSFNATDYLNIRDIVSDNLTIACTVYGYAGFAIYDANKTVILSVTGDNSADYGITSGRTIQTFRIQRPDDAYYIRLSAWQAEYTQPSDLKISGCGYGDLNSRLSFVEREIDSIDTGTLSDKKVLVIGDSISTDAYGNYRKWVTDLINTGFFDGEKVTNSSQHATGFVARYDNRPNDFITRLKAIENPSQYDLVVVFGGINDYIQNIPMGSESGTDYTVSFKPAVNEFFNYLIENFTQARLCVLLPLRTYATWSNSVDEYQQAYGDYIKTVAKSYCLPVLNLTEDSGFFPWKTTFRNMWTLQPEGYESHDGVHPNEEYQSKYLAPMIKGFLKGLL